MKKEEIIRKVKGLNLPEGSYVVFGSCPLAVAGLRESNDIDMLVSPEVFESKKKEGWKEVEKGTKDKPLVKEDFELHQNWDFSTYSPTLQQLLKTATVVNGVPFASLAEVKKWKAASGRPKDIEDIRLIESLDKDAN